MGEAVTIRTGKMGHGKTLNAIKEIDEQAHNENRIVYYHNIDGLQPDKLKASWFAFDDPLKWYELPDNCIIVIDEAQRYFKTRDPRAPEPEAITKLTYIRHQGQEIVFITQDHRLLDVTIRRLCARHIHFSRVYGSSRLLRYEFLEASDYDKAAVRMQGDKSYPKLKKELFGVYKSASSHHFKLNIPKKIYLFGIVLLVAFYLMYSTFKNYFKKAEPIPEMTTASQNQPSKAKPEQTPSLLGSVIETVTQNNTPETSKEKDYMDTSEYLDFYTPRIKNLPHTAPAYDELTKPQTYPKLSCLVSNDKRYLNSKNARGNAGRYENKKATCQCYTQQGTPYDVEFDFCVSIVENGYFDPAKPDYNKEILNSSDSALGQSLNTRKTLHN